MFNLNEFEVGLVKNFNSVSVKNSENLKDKCNFNNENRV